MTTSPVLEFGSAPQPPRTPALTPLRGGTALIFRILLLPQSETFILNQAGAMQRFRPYYVGWRNAGGLSLPKDRKFTVNTGGILGRLREESFRFFGPTQTVLAHLVSQHPRLMHAHFAVDACAALPIAQKLGLPLVTTLHGYDVTSDDATLSKTRAGKQYVQSRVELQKSGALFLAVSEFIRDRAIAQGFPKDRTIVHRIGIDVRKFQFVSGALRSPVILMVGRLVEKKGASYLLEAMSFLTKTNPSAKLVIIGDGPQRALLQQQAASQNLPVEFLGVQSSDVVRSWMQRASVLCVPSVTAANGDSEGLPMVISEAQASGTPVVAFAHAGIPEAVIHGKTGFVAPERDSLSLARHIEAILGSEELREKLSAEGRRFVEANLDLHRQTALLEEIYETVCAGEPLA